MSGVGKELIEGQWVTGLPRENRQTMVEPETCGAEAVAEGSD